MSDRTEVERERLRAEMDAAWVAVNEAEGRYSAAEKRFLAHVEAFPRWARPVEGGVDGA